MSQRVWRLSARQSSPNLRLWLDGAAALQFAQFFSQSIHTMASHLDLEEQEQLDELKHFWKRWGDLITWVLIAVLGGYAAWMGWESYSTKQSAQSAVLVASTIAATAVTGGARTLPRKASLRVAHCPCRSPSE